MKDKVYSIFEAKFQNEPVVIFSPGRVNMIGEHTDYNNGFVLPAAVDLGIYFAVEKNDINLFRFYSIDFDDYFETPVNQINKSNKLWANYLLGVIAQFVKNGENVSGFDCVFSGNLPIGAGMSSSAAVETGLAFAIDHLEDFCFSKLDLTKFSQKAEHDYADVQCGIMDQFAAIYGKANHVIKLDCKSLDYQYYPLKTDNYQILLVNTGVKHSLASSEYNKRRNECNEGVTILQLYYPEIQSLRDVNIEMLRKHKDEFNPLVFKRCVYVLEENLRVDNACNALLHNDFHAFGELMYASHSGLRDQYEVSCKELDFLVDLAENIEGVVGSRMMGGGFGGCTINLVITEAVENFENIISTNYKTPDGDKPQIIRAKIGDGTKLI